MIFHPDSAQSTIGAQASASWSGLLAAGIGYSEAVAISEESRQICSSQDQLLKRTGEIVKAKIPKAFFAYSFWANALVNHLPVPILLMGVTGVGKSTITAQIMNRIGNVSHIRVSLLRNILREYLSDDDRRLVESPSYRAFAFWKEHSSDPVLDAYFAQNRVLVPAIRALVEATEQIGSVTVFEGVNVDPSLLHEYQGASTHQLLPFLITVTNPEMHWSLLEQRHNQHPRPPVSISDYQKSFENIRHTQDYLIKRAKSERIPILSSDEFELDTLVTAVLSSVAIRSHLP